MLDNPCFWFCASHKRGACTKAGAGALVATMIYNAVLYLHARSALRVPTAYVARLSSRCTECPPSSPKLAVWW